LKPCKDKCDDSSASNPHAPNLGGCDLAGIQPLLSCSGSSCLKSSSLHFPGDLLPGITEHDAKWNLDSLPTDAWTNDAEITEAKMKTLQIWDSGFVRVGFEWVCVN
jgi:hypothetical protein